MTLDRFKRNKLWSNTVLDVLMHTVGLEFKSTACEKRARMIAFLIVDNYYTTENDMVRGLVVIGALFMKKLIDDGLLVGY